MTSQRKTYWYKLLMLMRSALFAGMLLAASSAFAVLLVASNRHQVQIPFKTLKVTIDHHTGHYFVTENQIHEVFKQLYPDSQISIGQINLYQLERKVKQNPYIRSVQVYTDMKGTVNIDIVQKQPLLRIINSNGVSYYLDERGDKMPVSDNFTSRVPVATGYIEASDSARDASVLGQLNVLINFIRGDSLLYALCEQIDVNEKGEFEFIAKMSYHRFLLGDTTALEQKFRRMKIFYSEILTSDTVANYREVNLKFNNQIICTKTI